MNPKLPLLSGKQVMTALQRMGFEVVHRNRWTLKGALRDAEIEETEFLKNT